MAICEGGTSNMKYPPEIEATIQLAKTAFWDYLTNQDSTAYARYLRYVDEVAEMLDVPLQDAKGIVSGNS